MMSLIVYTFEGRYYMFTLGCCEDHQTREDIFTEGGEEEIFTIFHIPGESLLETLRLVVDKAEERGITDIEGIQISLNNHQPLTRARHHRVH